MSASNINSGHALSVETDPRAEGLVYRLTINSPKSLNILNSAAIAELSSALAQIADDENCRAVVLAGAGDKAWIGGADINEMVSLDRESARAFITGLHGVCHALRELPVPVIASINGYCLGAGLEVAACCDLRIAAPSSRFGMPEVQVGIPSVIEAAVLPSIIGAGRARDLVMTGRIISAAEADAWGFVERIDPNRKLDTVVNERVSTILSAGPRAIRLQKTLCRKWDELPLDQAVQAGIDAFSEAYGTDEPKTYMQNFLQRRRG